MKKNIIILLLSAILVFLIFYMNFGKSAQYEILSPEDAPSFIQDAIQNADKKIGYSVFQDETNTYIYYHSDSVPNEYITTELDVKVIGGKYVATATVANATNAVNTDILIKLEKIADRDISLKVNIK